MIFNLFVFISQGDQERPEWEGVDALQRRGRPGGWPDPDAGRWWPEWTWALVWSLEVNRRGLLGRDEKTGEHEVRHWSLGPQSLCTSAIHSMQTRWTVVFSEHPLLPGSSGWGALLPTLRASGTCQLPWISVMCLRLIHSFTLGGLFYLALWNSNLQKILFYSKPHFSLLFQCN